MNVLLIVAAVITSVSTAKAPLSASAMKAMSYRPVGRLALKQVLQNNWGAKIRCRGLTMIILLLQILVPLLGVHRAVLSQRVGLCVAATADMSWTLMANPAQVS